MRNQLQMMVVACGLMAGCGSAVDDTADPASSTPSVTYVDGKADNLYDCPQCSIDSTCSGDVEITYAVDCTGAVCQVHAEERRDCALEGLVCMAGTCVDDAAPPPQPAASVKRVFVTNLGFDGNLAAAAGVEDGLEAADTLCQLEADGANLGGQWKAWLSSETEDAVERIADVGPWYLVDEQTLVAESLAQLVTQGARAPIQMEPAGTDSFSANVWTASGATGRFTTEHGSCEGWTTNGYADAATGNSGSSHATRWASALGAMCYHKRRLYCFEQ